MGRSPWPEDADLWFMASQRTDGKWVVIGGTRDGLALVGRSHASKADAVASIALLWASLRDVAHDVLIGDSKPERSPI